MTENDQQRHGSFPVLSLFGEKSQLEPPNDKNFPSTHIYKTINRQDNEQKNLISQNRYRKDRQINQQNSYRQNEPECRSDRIQP